MCLNSSIICKDGTGEGICAGTVRVFCGGTKFLAGWRRVAKQMFPKDESLEEDIPHPRKLHLGRLPQDKPWLIGDGCCAATFSRECLESVIKEAALRYSLKPKQIKVYEMISGST